MNNNNTAPTPDPSPTREGKPQKKPPLSPPL